MILPQYSLRKLLAITVGAALICLVLSWGVQGYRWAFGISMGALSILAALLVQGVMFWFVWLFATLADRKSAARRARALQLVPAASNEDVARSGPVDARSVANE